jgi:hypothetical protein
VVLVVPILKPVPSGQVRVFARVRVQVRPLVPRGLPVQIPTSMMYAGTEFVIVRYDIIPEGQCQKSCLSVPSKAQALAIEREFDSSLLR